MKKFLKYFLGLGLLVFLSAYIFIPGKGNLSQISELFILLPLLFYVFIPKFLKQKEGQATGINLGLVFFMVMIGILIVGNITNYVIKHVYPLYDDNIRATNFYYIAGIFFFSLGFLWQYNNKILVSNSKYIIPVKVSYIFIFTGFSFISAIVSYRSIGFIPFISSTGSGMRYLDFASFSFYIRVWSLCVVSSIFAYVYFYRIRKSVWVFGLFILSILISFFFLIRMYPFLILLTIFLIWYGTEHSMRRKLVYVMFFVAVFFLSNMYFVDYREKGNNLNEIRTEQSLTYIQRNLFYTTFGEYGQMKTAINTYTAEPQYGKTLLSIPLGFIPAPLLLPFGVIKSDIQKNNSAVLMADFLESRNSTGIRIGILGELFINFKFFGCFFMIFLGIAVGYIQKKISKIEIKDVRYGMYLIIYSVLLYSLIGQIDAIGSILGNYVILFFLIKLFCKKQYLGNKA